MRILFICGREVNYPRNAFMLRSLQQIGEVDTVVEVGQKKSILLRSLKLSLLAFPRLLSRKYGLVFVGFYGNLLMMPVSVFSRVPILFDAFLSTYDTLCFDRKVISPHSLAGWAAYQVDRFSGLHATRILIDTSTYKNYFEKTFGFPTEKIYRVFVGCDEDLFFPCPEVPEDPVVLFYGSYLPLHGVDIIVRAARLLRDELPLRFLLIGEGADSNLIHKLANELEPNNVDFYPSVPLSELPDKIARATICLGGHFGTTEKAGRVIAGKTYQCLAMAKPVIVGENPANHELLEHGKDAWFCAMNDPGALAEAIRTLYHDQSLRAAIAKGGYQTFLEKASFPILTKQMESIVRETTS